MKILMRPSGYDIADTYWLDENGKIIFAETYKYGFITKAQLDAMYYKHVDRFNERKEVGLPLFDVGDFVAIHRHGVYAVGKILNVFNGKYAIEFHKREIRTFYFKEQYGLYLIYKDDVSLYMYNYNRINFDSVFKTNLTRELLRKKPIINKMGFERLSTSFFARFYYGFKQIKEFITE